MTSVDNKYFYSVGNLSLRPWPFSLDSTTGHLTVSKGAVLDYESISYYILQIIAIDSGTPSYNVTGHITVRIANINEQPTNISLDYDQVSAADG